MAESNHNDMNELNPDLDQSVTTWLHPRPEEHSATTEALAATVLAFACKYKLPNYGVNDLLRRLKTSPTMEVNNLPLTLAQLECAVLPESATFLVTWFCRGQGCSRIIAVETSPRRPQAQTGTCCGINYTTNDSHSVYLPTRALMRIFLPRLWTYRHEHRLPAYLINKMLANKLDPHLDISITVNVDGVPVSKSSNCSMWPILRYVDGLPHSISKNNILLFGIYVSHDSCSSKPDMNKFLSPFVATMQSLLKNGVTWHLDSDTEITSRILLSKVLCDSMARPSVQYLQQMNGTYGCGYCFHRETRHYFQHGSIAESRNNDSHRQICNSASFLGPIDIEVTRGILGRSILLDLCYFDIITDLPPCYMHTIYLGVARTFTQFLLTDMACPGRLRKDQLQQLTDNLVQIKPPHRVSRTPRSFAEMAHWKAHEWGMWLLYYSPVLLYHTASRPYWYHWIQLVFGCSVLLTSSYGEDYAIIEQRLSHATESLESFSQGVADLYGPRALRFNVHLLRHLPSIAKLWGGDILNLTMSPFESFNAVLQGFINNSQYMGFQVARRYWAFSQTQGRSKTLIPTDKYFGEFSAYHLPEGLVIPSSKGNVLFCSHIILKSGRRWYSSSYKRSKLRFSSWVTLQDGRFAEIQAFGVSDCGIWAIVRIMLTTPFATLSHIVKITGTSFFEVINVNDLDTEVIKVEFQEERYACRFLNSCEHNRE